MKVYRCDIDIEKYCFVMLGFDSEENISRNRNVASYFLPEEFPLPTGEKREINEINNILSKTENLYPYDRTGATQKSVDLSFNGYPVGGNPKYKDVVTALNNGINTAIAHKNKARPDSYPEELHTLEKDVIFKNSKNGNIWIPYPIIDHGICIAILIAYISENDVVAVLQQFDGHRDSIIQDFLDELIRNNIKCPTVDIGSLDDILTLFSLIASFSGFKTAEVESSSVNFKLYANLQDGFVLYECPLPKPFNEISIKYVISSDPSNVSELPRGLTIESVRSTIIRLVNLQRPRIQTFCQRLCAIKESAKAAIMARNFSHNVGSHALANPNIYRKIGLAIDDKKIKPRLETFHSYMQGRLDFLARAISDQSGRPEPLFFLNDVMNGFFKQGVLLDTLVDDAGFPAEKIKFCVAIGKEDGGSSAVYEWSKDTHCFSCAKPLSDDPVVGIPGGMVGTHALYAFLENILRNAVKYGAGVESLKAGTENELEIHLQLYQCSGQRSDSEGVQPAWILSVWDNVSDGGNCADIRNHINTPLIQEKKDGALKSEGHGIQEMKLCAEALAGDLRFPVDKGKVQAGQALRCYVKRADDKGRLVYDLLLPNPVLLGIVPLGDEIDPDTPPPYVKYYKSIDELAEDGAQIGVLLDNGCSDKGTVLNRIAQLHTCLPFRLMVLTEKKEDAGSPCSWEKTLEGKTLNKGVDFQWGKQIPHNRLRIHADKALWDVLKSGNPNGDKFIGCTAWQAVMLRAYDSWLRAYKKVPEGKWNLCIGFDHGGSTNITRWETGVNAINGDANTCIAISVVSKNEKQQGLLLAHGVTFTGDENGNNKKLQVNNGIKDSLLMFDNHKKAFGVPPDDTKFYQGMGKNEGLTLYQSMTSPPQSGLGFGLFVYSLVEGALTRVYTLDERVAEAVSDDLGKVDDDNVSAYNSANIMPLFRFDRKNKKFYISKAKLNVNNDIFKLGKPSLDDADVLLIHEGVMDLLSNNEVGIWQREKDAPKLFAHAPFVVRVSGRGRETRHLDDAISFLEFNELSGNTYQEMNKPRLVKALLGSSGSYKAACKSKLIQSSTGGE